MKLIRPWVGLLAAGAFCLTAPAGVSTKPAAEVCSSTTSAPAATCPASTCPTTAAAAEAIKSIRNKAFEHLTAGEFRVGLKLLESSADKITDKTAVEARVLTAEYLKSWSEADAERQSDLAVATERVHLARLAKDYRPKLIEAALDEKLFDGLEAVADAVQAASEVLQVQPTTRPADARLDATKHIKRAKKELLAVVELPGDGHGKWGEAFSRSADELGRALAAQELAWSKATLPADWRKLRLAGEEVQAVLIDLGVLVARDPLLTALGHARAAKELSGDGEQFLRQQWVRELMGEAQQHGAALVEQGKWTDALSVYGSGGLSGLDEDNLAYKEMLKRIARHVHVIGLYGRGGSEEEVSTQSAGGDGAGEATEPEDEPRWAEVVVGIDTAMVRNIISRLGQAYVEQPDYRRLGVAALQGLKVLAGTPKAAEALPSLARVQQRTEFLAGLEKLIVRLRDAATVDHLDVTLALNSLHELCDSSLGLPSEVVDKEFAEAMLAELDQFTWVVWPYASEDFNKRTRGSFTGIGVQIRKQVGEPIEVVTPLADTPAFRAGIRAGDYIVKVNGRPTRTIALERAVRLITGPAGTTVTLTVRRAGMSKPFNVGIVRGKIYIQTVKGWRRLPDGKWLYLLDAQRGIGYVRITQFTRDTPMELRLAIADLRAAGAKGMILDLRFNPGGLLTPAVEVTDEFLRDQLMIVRTKGRNVREVKRQASAAGQYQNGELVMLVNQFSASAAEIASGAMKEWNRATVVGTRTYGKGSVQRVFPLRPKGPGELKLTTAYYYLPSGRCLHRTNGAKQWGVDPHLAVPVTVRQMNRWAEIRQETDLLKAVDPGLLDELLRQQLREDLQLRAALLLLRLKLAAEDI